MSNNSFQIVPAWSAGLGLLETFFSEIKDNKFFHPHPFTENAVWDLCLYSGRDLFYTIVEDEKVIGYGLLRGIEEGWKDVCLGIYILDRGKGLGELLMHFLHIAAARRGLKRLRLHTHPDNEKALGLYRKMGYEFNGEKHGNELIGYKCL